MISVDLQATDKSARVHCNNRRRTLFTVSW